MSSPAGLKRRRASDASLREPDDSARAPKRQQIEIKHAGQSSSGDNKAAERSTTAQAFLPVETATPDRKNAREESGYGIGLFRHTKKYSACQPPEQTARRARIERIKKCSEVDSPYELIPTERHHGFPQDPLDASAMLMQGISDLSLFLREDVKQIRKAVEHAAALREVQPNVLLARADLENALRSVMETRQAQRARRKRAATAPRITRREVSANGGNGTSSARWPAMFSWVAGAMQADVDALDEKGYSTAHTCVLHKSHNILRLLLESGARADRSAANGRTLLHDAAVVGDLGTIALLSNAVHHLNGLDPDAIDEDGQSAHGLFNDLRHTRVSDTDEERTRVAFALQILLEELRERHRRHLLSEKLSEKLEVQSTVSDEDFFEAMDLMESSVESLPVLGDLTAPLLT
ncbi:hypothetical protein LTS10_007289 [Elasticomyces elasticus]|nr:hypothetical protein LTS10_007289 [Elasticomyces elasticus]